MKKEQKEKVIKVAQAVFKTEDGLVVLDNARVKEAPDAYWVQAWISVPLTTAIKS